MSKETCQTIRNSPQLTWAQFSAISRIVKERSGINLHEKKKALVEARLQKRLRELHFSSYGEYMNRILKNANDSEINAMLDALSTNVTYFFRESRHFEYLQKTGLPRLMLQHREDRRIRIWSAGCSSGEEAYSIAMLLRSEIGDVTGWDFRVLATDISRKMLKLAKEGVYDPQQFRYVPCSLRDKNFSLKETDDGKHYCIKPPLRNHVDFAYLNLMDAWPMRGPFDAIFCRNVMIYFEKATQHILVERFRSMLAPGGVLFIGHSESISNEHRGLQMQEPAVYLKTALTEGENSP